MAPRATARAAQPALEVWKEFADGSGQPSEEGPEIQELQGCPEAQAWLTALTEWCESADGARVKQQLSELLRCGSKSRDKLVGVANRARQQIANIFSWAHHMEDPPSVNNPARARQCQYLFERALHGVLNAALAEEEAAAAVAGGASPANGAADAPDPGSGAALSPARRSRVVEAMLADEEFQLGLVHACIEAVNFAHLRAPAEAFPWVALQLSRLHSSVELWQGIDWVVDHLGDPPADAQGCVPGMPDSVVAYLSSIQVRVEEELAFIDGSSLYKRIVATGASLAGDKPGSGSGTEGAEMDGDSPQQRRRRTSHSPRGLGPNAALVGRFLSNLACSAMLRAAFVSKELLAEHPDLAGACPLLAARGCAVMDAVLCDQLDLLFGQHLSVVIACALFWTIRVHGCTLPFRKLTALMAARLPNHDAGTFGRVELPLVEGAGWDGSRDYGDTRAFYNRVFLPAMQAAGYEAAALFGEESMAPTPAKEQLEAPAGDAPETGQTAAAGSVDTGSGKRQAAAGAKERRRLRRPLGQVTNAGSRGNSTGRGRTL